MKMDDELNHIFIEEARDILVAIHKHLEKWQSSAFQPQFLTLILRELHTLKGSARMVGLPQLSEYVHGFEQIVQKQVENKNPQPQSAVKAIQQPLDYLNSYIEIFANTNIPPEDQTLFDELEPSLEEKIEEEATEWSAKTQNVEKVTSSTEVVRIKTTLLEKFSKLAGQVNIARSQLEQQLGEIHGSLVEMSKEMTVMKEQTRYLQVKTDAGLRKFQSALIEKGYDEYDAMELDRYSFLQQTTRVLEEKLNQLQSANAFSLNLIRNLDTVLIEQGRSARSLEEEITHIRMISITHLVDRLERIVRQVSHELGKEVRFQCTHAQGDIDRRVLERLIPPLEHMVRNSIDHGIEAPFVRTRKGKPAYGVISLSLQRQGNEILIQLSDDGQGIDLDKVRAVATQRGLWSGSSMTMSEALQLITTSGFSTKDKVTPISGRGVGMDVVSAEVNKLGGALLIETQRNKGAQFTIRLPFTLSLNRALILTTGKYYCAVPLSYFVGITRLPATEIQRIMKQSKEISYAKERYKIFFLADILEDVEADRINKANALPVIFLRTQSQRVAFIIDQLIGSKEIVIKPVGTQLQFVRELTGVSLLGEGQIAFVLNAQFIIQSVLSPSWRKKSKKIASQEKPVFFAKKKVLIVDDSITVRQVTSRILKRHNYETLLARDGEEALKIMSDNVPDIVLLDVEMPRMDGFVVLAQMRKNMQLKEVPVIMITSRAGERHQIMARTHGANAFLPKPYQEEELLTLLRRLIKSNTNER